MSNHAATLPSNKLTSQIIQAFFDVYNELGYGLSEKYYSSALEILLNERGFVVQREVPIKIHFHGHYLGLYRSDLLVNDCILIENKAGAVLPLGSKEQLINCLTRSRYKLGLLFFFGPSPEFKRVIDSEK